ncbi:LOW QUALITY PROTEIN: alpha-N-acetylglucosaminidase-like [Physella acuta]|uniref:LOW QUALITY PROTEIN: alpha-N-acetylglucosaminidase-like n=1 Tax=Physella acuta TaxID=109671 RepID=UPI0027DBCFE1|nr:LOW QUALITY PROTEIN: alpha-N-acetylglucosaminidase-like [Physella acuta]
MNTISLLRSTENGIEVTGTSGVAASIGFYYYLKYYCNGQRTWAGQQTELPPTLPVITTPIKITTNDKFRYYQNVCTVSYTMAFWQWPRWEQEIDWMAMQGINLPLAFTGQEAIFQRVYMNMGFTQTDMDGFFGGPAFSLGMTRMGNIQGWGGPLPQMWITNKLILQHQILERMRSFGMIPVLPAFAGHVPSGITRILPQAKVSRLPTWSNFNETYSATYLLDFQDPLFTNISKAFIEAQANEFGTDHIYNADTFNEMTPTSSDPTYISNAGKAVYYGMLAGDPQAVWLMQGWLFYDPYWTPTLVKALVTSVPQERLIVLDLDSENGPLYQNFESYYGQPFIWCMLHNFGVIWCSRSVYPKVAGASLVDLLADLDHLLSANERFLLGTWIADARSWATDADESKLYEYNARNQITLWGPTAQICD